MEIIPQPTFGAAVKKGFANLFNLKGRARRSEYWYMTLVSVLILMLVSTLFTVILLQKIEYINHHRELMTERQAYDMLETWMNTFLIVTVVVSVVLMFAVTVRRLHDRGIGMILPLLYYGLSFAGYYIIFYSVEKMVRWSVNHHRQMDDIPVSEGVLIFCGLSIFVAGILGIVIFIFTLLDSSPEPNKYGASPKYVPAEE